MPCWFYDKKALLNTPSIQDGIAHEIECQYRQEGAQLIIQIGSQMELGYNTLATGVVYFHRFYMFHSFKTFSPYITACCCLFLAGKAEETPKKSKDIIKIAKKFLSKDKLLSFGENPREEVMIMEKILLQTMKFDLKVRHPYSYILKYSKCLKGDKRKKQKMIQMAWTFINDSLCTTLSIQWEPEIIAIAVMYLASKLVKFKILGWSRRKPSHKHWWEIFVEDLTLQVVEDICHQVLDLYSPLSRYCVIYLSQPTKPEPKNSIVQSDTAASTNTKIFAKDPKLENGLIPASSSKDPRLENGSLFVKSHIDVNTSNPPVLVTSSTTLPGNMKLTPSPATPTAPQPMDQSLQDNSRISTRSNVNRDPRDTSRFPACVAKFNPPAMSLPLNPLDNLGKPMFKKGFGNVDNWQPMENQGFTNNYNRNDYNDNRLMRNRGYGRANNNSDDCSENRPMRNRDYRNYGRDNRFGYGQNRFRRRSFENNNYGNRDDRSFRNQNHSDDRSYNENRLMKNRGFGYTNNNSSMDNEIKPSENRGFGNGNCNDDRSYNENRSMGNRGFGNINNNNSMCNEIKPFDNRRFGNGNRTEERSYNDNRSMENQGFQNINNNNNRYNENKPFGNKGFGNSGSYNNNRNDNDSRPRMRYDRGNRFQRSDIYPRRFNNNYENDRYSHNDTNRDPAKGFMSDAPGKILDKQRFYHPSNEKANPNLEEESWD